MRGRGADYPHEVDFGALGLPCPSRGLRVCSAGGSGAGLEGRPSAPLAAGKPLGLHQPGPPRAGHPARRVRLSAYVTGGHAGAPARGKQGGGGGQGGVWEGEVADCLRVQKRGWGRSGGANRACHTLTRCPLWEHPQSEPVPRDGFQRTGT